jgi:hypothetical protein
LRKKAGKMRRKLKRGFYKRYLQKKRFTTQSSSTIFFVDSTVADVLIQDWEGDNARLYIYLDPLTRMVVRVSGHSALLHI